MSIKEVPEKTPKSKQVIVDLLREYLQRSYTEEITFIEIDAVVNGCSEKRNISTHTLSRPET